MAREVRRYSVTIPAGTPASAPYVADLVMPARVVRQIMWRVPPGPRGLMGFQIASSGVQVIPWNTGEWIVADDESDIMPLDGQITSGAWQAIGYNTGRYGHAVYLRFLLDPPDRVGSVVVPSIPAGDLSSGSAGGSGGAPDGSDMPGGDGSGGGVPGGGPPPGASPAYAEGWQAARTNALAAMGATFGLPGSPDPVPRPVAGTDAGTGYDDGKSAALAALAAVPATQATDAPADGDGYAIARARAVAAIHGALGGPVATDLPPAPVIGSPERADYDAGKSAALAALARV